MDLTPLIPIVAIVANRGGQDRADARHSAGRTVGRCHRAARGTGACSCRACKRELAETQERLDFAERLLSKAREER